MKLETLLSGTYDVMANDIVSQWEETLRYNADEKCWNFERGGVYPAIVHEVFGIKGTRRVFEVVYEAPDGVIGRELVRGKQDNKEAESYVSITKGVKILSSSFIN